MDDVAVGGSGTGGAAEPEFDEEWYLGKYSQVQDLIIEGKFTSARQHYVVTGRDQGWLPRRPPGDNTRFAPPQREFVTQPSILRLLRMIAPQSCPVPKVRVGQPSDGGYVINNDFVGISGVVSLGIGNEASFDAEFADAGVPVFQYDPTVDGPPYKHPNCAFHKLGWGARNDDKSRTLDAILDEHQLRDTGDLLLKFDVEYAEWEALAATSSETLSHFRIIVGEFHGFGRMTQPAVFDAMSRVFSLLSETHAVTHIHGNNHAAMVVVMGVAVPHLMEISFLRRDRSVFTPSCEPIPGPLDYPNNPVLPDLVVTPFR